ncbi:transcriptional regulator with XRE-family HTH domain [Microbacterium testaceum]|jgi:transcriptional regulator with XRE-family HTH domain|uniref:helix-turn-helix domain-containing protein n=1 Tax=Microbacterium TaxID=33882 RepID=UPI002781EEE1|nr:helix-turn-helix transcriptional regulator [Microbacterium testaceum]MDQ1172838.1 transcriptional regulator with XRE-family HTH domain [Microbacterium testaceum]
MTDVPDPWSDFVRELGLRIFRARSEQHLSQEQVAHAAGLATFTYRKLEKGESNPGTSANPRLRTIVAVSEVLGVPLPDLIPTPPKGLPPER